jgi:hypothetical protein
MRELRKQVRDLKRLLTGTTLERILQSSFSKTPLTPTGATVSSCSSSETLL